MLGIDTDDAYTAYTETAWEEDYFDFAFAPDWIHPTRSRVRRIERLLAVWAWDALEFA